MKGRRTALRPVPSLSGRSGALVTLVLTAALAATVASAAEPGTCPVASGVLGSELWASFVEGVEVQYLAPRGVPAEELSAKQWAKLLGHALGRQASHVGEDPDRRVVFNCLELGVSEALRQLHAAHEPLPGWSREEGAAALARTAREAMVGFYDEEIVRLTGVAPPSAAVSIFDAGARLPEPGDPSLEAEPSSVGDAAVPPAAGRRCRFNLRPSLYTSAHPTFEWVLVRQERRGGYYFDTVEVDPDWPAEHSRRPENRLKPGQEILARGTKAEILDRIRVLQGSCG